MLLLKLFILDFWFVIDFTTWSKIAPKYCNGSQQSPINIVTASVQGNPSLTSFNLTGFDDNSTFMSIVNSGESGKDHCTLGTLICWYYNVHILHFTE